MLFSERSTVLRSLRVQEIRYVLSLDVVYGIVLPCRQDVGTQGIAIVFQCVLSLIAGPSLRFRFSTKSG
jgi:hypothetical protein